ncbi:glutathione transferase GstA [Pseudomonas sp. CBSPBW29]|jgi:glutathione S-transferase|uniref:glutathione transferase GstA n=1 Tax=Pseudomonas TaxID=286 RepID=UPI0021AC8A55|nr:MULTISPECIES: glutathione transferase GstA [unclassified Pseudomonas]WEL41904.1 glutathione transferase GstA [Pseudomonas sp. CBSPBW29]WEL62968.1 glutathione transferase GstA [Pseudomonas sp. CBSPGW29]WEL72154.1 glutathione transferase GstA [Pseudomonas sp. CBSPCGW29]WEL79051.1 glutathione transferase GstA [Pseudomonas sp. CBSPAW29]WEL82296.1 glutathione transferase GstA [Pseudomonas sp. CBSPCAW29]WEL90772.1 glutathione transferase GstA [Pseudomonas sp. CBSPCBW29]
MKLYFSPNACSLASHIVLRELALPFELIRVDNQKKLTADGDDFLQINPKGYVAALQLDNGEVLTEGAAILQYLADRVPAAGLAPANGSWERVRLQEWLNFVSSEIHGGLGVLFKDAIPDEVKALFKATLFKRFAILVQTLERQDYLLGAQYSVADAYLFVVLRWAGLFDIDLQQWPALAKFQQRVGERPAVIAALAAENS